MNRFDIPLTAEGLTAYAIERQNGWERHRPTGAPSWTEQRRFWTNAILQGMAGLEGEQPDPKLMEQFDRGLEQARSGFATVRRTSVYQEAVQEHPYIAEWPALCTVYVGRDLRSPSQAVDASVRRF